MKKSASGVLSLLSCSRTHLYALRAKRPAALLDGPFLTFPVAFGYPGNMAKPIDIEKIWNYSTDPEGKQDTR
ncbi:MAG: hypothetical protein V3T42_01850 [Nitrospirales bacterium]